MPVIPIRVEIMAEDHPELRRKHLAEINRATHYAIGRKWTDSLLADHFRPGASTAFGYKQRSAGYLKKKLRMASRGHVEDGGRSPLVFTGTLRRTLLGTRQLVQGQPTRTVITLYGPSYFHIRPRSGNRPNLGAEVIAVNDRHEKILDKVAENAWLKQYHRLQAMKRSKA